MLSEDVEWNPGGFNTGFSPAAIRAFARRANLDPAGLTPPLIWSKHRKQWNDFRAWQTLELVKLYYGGRRRPATRRCSSSFSPAAPTRQPTRTCCPR